MVSEVTYQKRREPVAGETNRVLVLAGALVMAFGIFAGIAFIALMGHLQLPFQDCVAVVNVDGEISSGGTAATLLSAGSPGSEEIADTISSLGDRNDVKAVVVEINSPGGGVVASKQIYDSLKGLNKTKVAYLYEEAASGGYYTALGTDYIVAEPDTLTGSIGVISEAVDISSLMNKIGVNVTVIKSAGHKDFLSEFKSADPEEVAIMQGIINETYAEFVSALKDSRGDRVKASDIPMLTDGRIVSGRQALKYGLVDKLGNKEDAIKEAADLAGMQYDGKPNVCAIAYPSQNSGGLFSEIGKAVATIYANSGGSSAGLYMK